MKRWLLFVLLCMSFSVHAVEVGGVRLEEDAHVGHKNLVLNGAGVRCKFFCFFDSYVIGLYLAARQDNAVAVLAGKDEKRIAMYLLRDTDSKSLFFAFKKAFNENLSKAETRTVQPQLYQFESIFININELKKGDSILMDYLPEQGTQIIVNGSVRGVIEGTAFYTSLLKVWLGDKPTQKNLKLTLLGGA